MSFGDKRLDASYDQWATQTPEDYFGYEDDEELTAQEMIDEVTEEENKK